MILLPGQKQEKFAGFCVRPSPEPAKGVTPKATSTREEDFLVICSLFTLFICLNIYKLIKQARTNDVVGTK